MLRHAYNVVRSDETDIDFGDEPSMTKQEFKDECDINVLMKRFAVTGVAPGVGSEPLYGDFSEAGDFLQAQLVIKRAEMQFEGLSSDVRDRFGNDPAKFLAFVSDPKNVNEAVKLGLASKRVVPPVVPPAEPPPAAK